MVPIQGHPDYFIHPNGDIYSSKMRRLMKPVLGSSKYLSVSINGKSYLLHRLLATQFIPNTHNKPYINHKDGCKLNNALDNLEWCTAAENQKHAYQTGIKKPSQQRKGFQNSNAKLTREQVDAIRYLYPSKTTSQLAEEFNVGQSTITRVVRYQLYTN